MFVLDEEINNIKNTRILPLLNEVKSSFYQGNYRSAVVINYTAIIMDILDKLIDLSEIYQDQTAQDILNQVEDKRQKNKNSEWENFLIQEVKNRTELIDGYEFDDLMEIKRQRNNAAHPMTTYDGNTWELKTISKETCQDVIRKSFEIVFLKPPILGRKINDKIIEFAKRAYSAIGITDDDFKISIRGQYLDQLGSKPKERLLKSLFKLIFNQAYNDQKANEGRQSSFALLKVLISEDKLNFLDIIKTDIEKFSLELENYAELSIEYDDLKIDELKSLYFADLIREFPSIREWIKDSTRINLKNNLEHVLDNFSGASHITKKNIFVMRCTTVIDTCDVHIKELEKLLENVVHNFRLSSFETKDLEKLYNTFSYYGENELLTEFLFKQMTSAKSFYQAEDDFHVNLWLAEKVTKNEVYEILFKFNENDQYYNNNKLGSFVDDFVTYYRTKEGIDLRNHYLGAIYTELNILSDKYTLSKTDYDSIFSFLEDKTENHCSTIRKFKNKYKDNIKAYYNNNLEDYPNLNMCMFKRQVSNSQ